MDGKGEKSGDEPANGFAKLHRELHAAHRSIQGALAEMEAVTADPAPDRERYSVARWRLSNASFARRTLWQRIYDAVADLATEPDRKALAELKQADFAMICASAEHVRVWTAAAIDADWAGYCAASKEVQWKMKAAMSVEQRLLHPLLARLSQTPGGGAQSVAA